MSEYVSMFGVTRVLGTSEGSSAKNDAAITDGITAKIRVSLKAEDGTPDKNVTDTAFGKGIAFIPQGAYIVSVKTFNASAVAGAKVGTYKQDGTVIDDDGLVAVAGITAGVANGAGALVGTLVNQDSYIKASGTLTGLNGFMVVEYAI